MKKIIEYFASRQLIANVFFCGTIIVAAICWQTIGKEELPEFARDVLNVMTIYPGAPAEDVELFVTKPIEEELKGVSGIYDIKSTSSLGSSSFSISIDPNYPDKDKVIQEIKDAVLRTDFPSEVRDIPTFRQFKSSEKAIIDIALIHKQHSYLDQQARSELQKYALSFENQMVALPEVSSIDKSGYLLPEIHVMMNPDKLKILETSISEIHRQIQKNHIRAPIGSLMDRGESKVTALNELDNQKALENMVVRGTYEGPALKLDQIADVKLSFERSNSILKVNGHEAIILNVKKSVSADILSAKEALMKFIEQHRTTNSDSPVEIILMDDESYDVTNRLAIILTNGLLGFILVLLVLFLFLEPKYGFWVAMGIPFSLAFTTICLLLAGYTINNMTLAGLIIVMGVVVDDAIVIAENILRHRREGWVAIDAAIGGTYEVFKPVFASIITTCVAFVPLFFFEGFWGQIVSYIPLVVILMLAGSLIESVFILPSHLVGRTPLLKNKVSSQKDWFMKFEARYERFLVKVLNKRIFVFGAFLIFSGVSGYIFSLHMNFAMFPREEAKEIFIKVTAEETSTRFETAKLIEPLERIFLDDESGVVQAVRTSIGHSRRGGAVKENEGWLRVELLPASQRDVPLKQLMEGWEAAANKVEGFKKIKFFRSWFGSGSGSAIELLVQENDDERRLAISVSIKAFLEKIPSLSNVEIEKPLEKKEYLFHIDQEKLVRFDIDPIAVTTALRSFVEGTILYTINKGDEETDVRLTVPDNYKTDLLALLELKVENKEGQLSYLKNFVTIVESMRPTNISRMNYKRTMTVYGDMSTDPDLTPLEIAELMESKLFPKIYKEHPGAILRFTGEIEETRDSQNDFRNSIILALVMIYAILIMMFNSVFKPLIIMAIIPFGVGGAAFALFIHGYSVYGFFAVVGALGMIGVVVNDAIIMIDRLGQKSIQASDREDYYRKIAAVTATRFRPVLVTTITTVLALLPTAYGLLGYDSMLAEMMLTMAWGLVFATFITLLLVPSLYTLQKGSLAATPD